MAGSDHSHDGGAGRGHPHPPQHQPQQPHPHSYEQQPPHPQAPHYPPHQPAPPMPPEAAHQQAHAPQPQQPMPAGDEYYYPQGQNVLADTPEMAQPPQPAPVRQQPPMTPQEAYFDPSAGLPPQPAYVPEAPLSPEAVDAIGQTYEAGLPGQAPGEGDQISQRLAQLQNQYDQELASANWQPEDLQIGTPEPQQRQMPDGRMEPQFANQPGYPPQPEPAQAAYQQPGQPPMPHPQAPHYGEPEHFHAAGQQPAVDPRMAYQQAQPPEPQPQPQAHDPQMAYQQTPEAMYDPYAQQAHAAPQQAYGHAQPQEAGQPPADYAQPDYGQPDYGQPVGAPQQDYYQDPGALGPQPDRADGGYAQPAAGYDQGSEHHVAFEEPSGGGVKKLALGGAFVAALAIGGGGAYTYKYTDMFGGGASGPTPVVKANGGPVKVVKATGASQPSLNKSMHSRLSGAADPIADRLAEGQDDLSRKVEAAKSGMLQGGNKPNGPRRVKTLIVRPDGTILQPAGDDAPSATASNPMISPGINMDSLREQAAKPVQKAKSAAANAGSRVKSLNDGSASNYVRSAANATAPTKQRVKRSLGLSSSEVSQPIMLPGDRVKQPSGGVTPNRVRTVRVTPQGVVQPAAPTSRTYGGGDGSDYVVQVTARSSQTSALAAFADMQQRYPSLIGSYEPDIQRADLGAKGVWYRLRVGPIAGKSAAADLCAQLKSSGHPGCFVRKK